MGVIQGAVNSVIGNVQQTVSAVKGLEEQKKSSAQQTEANKLQAISAATSINKELSEAAGAMNTAKQEKYEAGQNKSFYKNVDKEKKEYVDPKTNFYRAYDAKKVATALDQANKNFKVKKQIFAAAEERFKAAQAMAETFGSSNATNKEMKDKFIKNPHLSSDVEVIFNWFEKEIEKPEPKRAPKGGEK